MITTIVAGLIGAIIVARTRPQVVAAPVRVRADGPYLRVRKRR